MTAKSNKELIKFGLIVSGYFIFFAFLLAHFHHHPILPRWGWCVLSFFIILFFWKPTLLLPFNWLYECLLNMLQQINSRILLGFVFFAIFSPIALLRRITHKNILHLSFNSTEFTYRMLISNEGNNDLRRPY